MGEQGQLIRLMDIDSDFILDLRYATERNFTGRRIYRSAECWMNKGTAALLIKARDIFRKDGYRVKIWDAYRPISAQKKFWEVMPDDDFVARPPVPGDPAAIRPTHLNGLCVDITLTDLDFKELVMPTEFDCFGPEAGLERNDHGSEGYKHASYMKLVMESVGFRAYENEWWHFYDVTTPPTPPLDFRI